MLEYYALSGLVKAFTLKKVFGIVNKQITTILIFEITFLLIIQLSALIKHFDFQ
jgi:hypothetical protein